MYTYMNIHVHVCSVCTRTLHVHAQHINMYMYIVLTLICWRGMSGSSVKDLTTKLSSSSSSAASPVLFALYLVRYCSLKFVTVCKETACVKQHPCTCTCTLYCNPVKIHLRDGRGKSKLSLADKPYSGPFQTVYIDSIHVHVHVHDHSFTTQYSACI